MRLRNGPHGYGVVTKLLHWATVAALLTQFVVGYVMVAEDKGFGETDCDPAADSRSGGDLSEAAQNRIDRIEAGTYAIAAAITPIVRPAIDAPIPMALITAVDQSSGKTTLLTRFEWTTIVLADCCTDS